MLNSRRIVWLFALTGRMVRIYRITLGQLLTRGKPIKISRSTIMFDFTAILRPFLYQTDLLRLIGKQLAILIQNLQKYKGLDLSRVHIIGFSLGAHVSGFAGAELPGLSRITGKYFSWQ